MKIYTRTGDSGETGLYGGQRVPKDDLRVETYGTVDEANAVLGVAAATLPSGDLRDLVLDLQGRLFTLGADLATPLEREERAGKALVPRVAAEDTAALETAIDHWEATLEPLRQFILPGGTPAAAALHQARAVARRAERRLVTLLRDDPDGVNAETLRCLNRLADLLFVLARAANRIEGVDDVPWTRRSA